MTIRFPLLRRVPADDNDGAPCAASMGRPGNRRCSSTSAPSSPLMAEGP